MTGTNFLFGHSNSLVVNFDTFRAQWVKRQRYQYKLKLEGKRSTLSDERVKLLNQIGFIWNSHDVVWEERWHELIAFKNTHGNCIVPSNYDKNPQLAVWVKVCVYRIDVFIIIVAILVT